MPKKIGEYKLIGTIDNITFYKSCGESLNVNRARLRQAQADSHRGPASPATTALTRNT